MNNYYVKRFSKNNYSRTSTNQFRERDLGLCVKLISKENMLLYGFFITCILIYINLSKNELNIRNKKEKCAFTHFLHIFCCLYHLRKENKYNYRFLYIDQP